MEKNMTDRLYDALDVFSEFRLLSLDARAELVLDIESKLRVSEDFPKGKPSGAIMFVCQECFRSGLQEPTCGDCNDESFICQHCGAETTYFEEGSSSCRSKKDVGNYRIKVVCSKCGKFIDYKDTELPEMDGEISHSLCKSCGRAQLAALK